MSDNPVMKILKNLGDATSGVAGRYSGGIRSAAWLEENLGAAGLTKREKASQYYVPGVKTTAGSATSRGASGVTMAQVMALPDTDVDKLTVMNALTQAEADAKVYAKMLSAIPKRLDSGEAPAEVVKLAAESARYLPPQDKSLFGKYALGMAQSAQTARQVSRVLGDGLLPVKQESQGLGPAEVGAPPVTERLGYFHLFEDSAMMLF